MGYKSRGGWTIPVCLKVNCVNQSIEEICKKCLRFSEYEPKEADEGTISIPESGN